MELCKKEDNTLLYLIIACAVTALLILIIIILICVICCKKKSKAKKTKQKVHKKFGRSAPRPVVVTSESGSEAELEGNSESPNEDLKIQKKTISNTISPISNKQNKEIAKTDKKEDKIKVETITHNYQGEIQSNKTRDNEKNNNRTEVHNKRLTYCEQQIVLTKSESSNDLFENEISFFEENEKFSNKIQKKNEDSTPHNDISMESKGIPRKLSVTSIDNTLQERPLVQEKKT